MLGYVVHKRIEKEKGVTAGFTAENFENHLSGSFWEGVNPGFIHPDCFTHLLWLPKSKAVPSLREKTDPGL